MAPVSGLRGIKARARPRPNFSVGGIISSRGSVALTTTPRATGDGTLVCVLSTYSAGDLAAAEVAWLLTPAAGFRGGRTAETAGEALKDLTRA